MRDLNKIAEQIRRAFAMGSPCSVPLMSVRDYGRLLTLLKDADRNAA